ncbi:putative Holliday junction resolvase [Chitinivorax tropicus]|uniref:Putative pre-16S rRNA nuclease n=1 Tax=Chitinivorax tropicus TaxID=714531 RepID=A0A840ML09_9PROT|nr:Holliday junction resolvase RuvX [Chitinivorax tropicus]MBB5019338.1 putative Holliday junction resolvase [Chitinivorax tropicus]
MSGVVTALPNAGGVLAFDFGEKRIGVATGDLAVKLATPLTTIQAESNDDRFQQIGRLIDEWQPILLIVGLPSYMDGTEHDMTRLCRKFSNRLHGRFALPVRLVDERLSSAVADTMLAELGLSSRKRKPALDQVAALQILQAFFDHPEASIAHDAVQALPKQTG